MRPWWLGAGALAALAWCTPARAQDTNVASPGASDPLADARLVKRLQREPGPSAHLLGSVGFGTGLRLNNPYRLSTQLGDDASSASLLPGFFDAGFGIAVGEADGLHHGGAVHLGSSLGGVWQGYVTPSYLLAYRASEPFLITGRAGLVVLLAPDVNAGPELAGSFSWMVTGAVGVRSELAFDLFYGAATLDAQSSVIPVLSAQLGLVIDYEVLP